MAYEQERFIFHSSGGCKSQTKALTYLGCGEDCFLVFKDEAFWLCFHQCKGQASSLGSVLEGTSPVQLWGLCPWPDCLLKSPPPNTITLESGFQCNELCVYVGRVRQEGYRRVEAEWVQTFRLYQTVCSFLLLRSSKGESCFDRLDLLSFCW